MRNFVKRKMTLLLVAPFLIGAASLAACAQGPLGAEPGWASRPAAAPLPPGWWGAVGRGATRAEAEDAAIIRLAQRIEARVRARERFTEGSPLDRRAVIETDARLLGAEIRETHYDRRTGEHAALAAIDRTRAASLLATRVRSRLDHDPPRLGPELFGWIEQGATLAPSAADWDALRRAHREALAAVPRGPLNAPERVAGALRQAFGASAASASWNLTPVVTYRSSERLTRWSLEATIAGEPRRWSGVSRGADLASAARRAERDAMLALEREAWP
jgi:hypothetical protein